MATVYHTYKQPRSTKKWNDKDAGNLPATVMRGYNVTSTVDAVDSTKYNVVVSGDAEGAGWYSSLRLPNGILIEEVVEEIATFVVQPTGAFPIWSYSLIVCRCPWSADEFLQPTYEHIAIASFDAETDETLAVIASYPVGGVSVLAFPMTPGAINWPIDLIESLRGVKQKLSVSFGSTLANSGVSTTLTENVAVPLGFSKHTIDNGIPVDYLTVSAWCRTSIAPIAGDAIVVNIIAYLCWDGEAHSASSGDVTVPINTYGASNPVLMLNEIDLSSI